MSMSVTEYLICASSSFLNIFILMSKIKVKEMVLVFGCSRFGLPTKNIVILNTFIFELNDLSL